VNIKRFFGKTSKEALSMVRKELGDNAVILSNRTINGGNEIMAFREEDIDALIQETDDQPTQKPRHIDHESDFVSHSAIFEEENSPSAHAVRAETIAQFSRKADMSRHAEANAEKVIQKVLEPEVQPFVRRVPAAKPAFNAVKESPAEDNSAQQIKMMLNEMRSMRNEIAAKLNEIKQSEIRINNAAARPAPQVQEKPAPEKNSAQKPVQNVQMQEVLTEVRNMRSTMESKLTSLSWNNIREQNPLKATVLSMLLNAGFSASLSRQLAEKLPNEINGKKMDGERARTWVKNILALNFKTMQDEEELFDQGGIFALIGPTGVGKTTTTAKLAARYVMRHGTQNLGIITTDAYRIGGHEQLRIYGKILGVMVHAVKDEADLKIALNELKNKHTILIDTVGVSQHDRMVAEQIALLSSSQRHIKKLLCLNATSTGETLADVIRAYRGKGLDGCIMTKVDEAATIGNAIDVMIRAKLMLYYVTNGQRVPEDIELADKNALIAQAFKRNNATQWPYQFLDEELPFVMGNSITKETNNAGELGYA
jgi:flagellar biosynthesis protein FlhF